MPTVAADAPARTAQRPLAPPPRWALALLTAMLFAVSGGVLWVVGLNYDGLTGSPASKIHPATYGASILVAWQIVRSGNPFTYAAAVARVRPASALLLVASLVMFASIVAGGAHNMAGTIDTFMLPVLLVFLTIDLDAPTRRTLEAIIHAIMIANALLALAEFAMDDRFFPFVVDGKTFEFDTRSTALGGHPLANAMVTACYVLALMSGGGALLGAGARALVVLLSLAALVVFGGRSAIVVTLVLGIVPMASRVGDVVRRGRVSLVTASALVLALPTLLGAGVALAATGFFAPLIDRFEDDGGSAEARVLMFDLFDQVHLRDLIVGPDPSYIDAIRRIAGLEMGIENPIVNLLLYRGVILTVMMLVAFALFVFELARRHRRAAAVPILGMLILVNTFESLAGKGVILAKFVIMIVVFFPTRTMPVNRGRAAH